MLLGVLPMIQNNIRADAELAVRRHRRYNKSVGALAMEDMYVA